MVFRNLIFQPEVVEQLFRAVVLSHHDQQASDDQNQTEHGQMLSSSMLLLNLILLIDVTFSTPTPVYVNNPDPSPTSIFCCGDYFRFAHYPPAIRGKLYAVQQK